MTTVTERTFDQRAEMPPVAVPDGHIGPVSLPGTNRMIWWTGRVAIGLRYQSQRQPAIGQSALWIQDLMLGSRA